VSVCLCFTMHDILILGHSHVRNLRDFVDQERLRDSRVVSNFGYADVSIHFLAKGRKTVRSSLQQDSSPDNTWYGTHMGPIWVAHLDKGSRKESGIHDGYLKDAHIHWLSYSIWEWHDPAHLKPIFFVNEWGPWMVSVPIVFLSDSSLSITPPLPLQSTASATQTIHHPRFTDSTII